MRSDEIREQVVYPHPIHAVWHALTDPAALGEWLMPNDFQARVGHEFTFTAPPAPDWDGRVVCRVTELVTPRRLAYTWRGSDRPPWTRWSLSSSTRSPAAPALP